MAKGGDRLVSFSRRPVAIRPRGAFTLIELLVVIAILALLMSLLMPALRKAKDAAKAAVCATNQRQIGIGWQLYWLDNNSAFPKSTGNMQWFYGGKHPSVWNDVYTLPYRPLNPYVARALKQESSAPIFRCPCDRDIRTALGGAGVTAGYPAYDYFGNSYMMNWLLLVPYDLKRLKPLTGQIFRLQDVQTPHAMTVLAGDCQWYYSVNDAPWDAYFHNRQDQVNLLFLDGHVSFIQIPRGQILTGQYSFWPYPASLLQ